jgi:ribonuclease P protein component
VRAERIAAGSGALRVHLAANGLAHPRFGFAIPRSVGGAVVRNTVRRRLKAALEPRRADLVGLDVIVSTSPVAATLSFAELDAELGRCLARALPQARRDAPGSPKAENGAVRPGPRRALSPSPA